MSLLVALRFISRRVKLSRVMSSSDLHTTSSNRAEFRELLHKSSKNIVVLSGAGVSAESGIPTFRGAGGLWRKYVSQELATPEAFDANPSLVWEFYSYRRELVLSKKPNKGHFAIADFQGRMAEVGKSVIVITQNIDGFHQAAGTKDVIELHGSLFKTRCTKCGDIQINRDSPIAPALAGKGAPDPDAPDASIPKSELPKCLNCDSMLRPHVVWFGEGLDPEVLRKTNEALDKCDACLLVGTSSVVYPAAGFAPMLAEKGVPVAEFNLETTSATGVFRFHFQGPAGETLPPILAPLKED